MSPKNDIDNGGRETLSKEEYIIPILKTYESDYKKFVDSKNDVELRKILVREMENKRSAQEEYKKKIKNLFKDTVVSKERIEDFYTNPGDKLTNIKDKQQEKILITDTEKNTRRALERVTDSLYNNQQIDISKDTSTPKEKNNFKSSILTPTKNEKLNENNVSSAKKETKKDVDNDAVILEETVITPKSSYSTQPKEQNKDDPIEITKVVDPRTSLFGRLIGLFRRKPKQDFVGIHRLGLGNISADEPKSPKQEQKITPPVTETAPNNEIIEKGNFSSDYFKQNLTNIIENENKVNPSEQQTEQKGVDKEAAQISLNDFSPIDINVGNEIPVSSKVTFMDRVRGLRSRKKLSAKQKKIIQEKQEKILRQEKLKKMWGDFEARKEKLKEMGIKMNDIHSYTLKKTPNIRLNKQNILFTGIIALLLISLVVILATVTFQPKEVIIISNQRQNQQAEDVITNENQVFVDLTSSPDTWNQSLQEGEGGKLATITKFVPYVVQETANVVPTISEFSNILGVELPSGLLRTLDEYYFVGHYNKNTKNQGIFIFSVRNYGDALVWMLSWEKDAINSFFRVFPNTFLPSDRESVFVESRIIDNKTVRILKNNISGSSLLYYFFDRETLVFITGDESLIPEINNRIRTAKR